jgi:hypothetical protein
VAFSGPDVQTHQKVQMDSAIQRELALLLRSACLVSSNFRYIMNLCILGLKFSRPLLRTMKPTVLWALIPSLFSATLVLGAVPISSVKRVSNQATVPNKFIIEVDQLSTIPNKRSFTRVRLLFYIHLVNSLKSQINSPSTPSMLLFKNAPSGSTSTKSSTRRGCSLVQL